jgi:nitroreductase
MAFFSHEPELKSKQQQPRQHLQQQEQRQEFSPTLASRRNHYAEQFHELISSRHSVRQFDTKSPVTDDDVRLILDAANRARKKQTPPALSSHTQSLFSLFRQTASAGNLQPFHVFVVRDAAMKRALALASANQEWLAFAPCILVFCAMPSVSGAKYGARGRNLYCVEDACIGAAYAQLMAHAMGMGSCWAGAMNEQLVMNALGGLFSPHLLPVALLAVGHRNPMNQFYGQRRQPLNQMFTVLESTTSGGGENASSNHNSPEIGHQIVGTPPQSAHHSNNPYQVLHDLTPHRTLLYPPPGAPINRDDNLIHYD